MLKKDLEDLGSRLEEAGANTATQVELNKKREGELGRLKSELEELNIAHEGTLAALRMKHNNTMADLGKLLIFDKTHFFQPSISKYQYSYQYYY